jgi:alcohol dehydrogenase
MDARPRIGARVAGVGQGPIGLLTTALLAAFPLAELVTVDRHESRRRLSESLGADRALSPDGIEDVPESGFDVAFELSGNPDALDAAIDVTGSEGRVIVGSWYGTKEVALDLGGAYHRSHVRIRSSQVSRIDPDHADRWDKQRRLEFVRSWLVDNDLPEFFTHEFDVGRASEAYRLLEERQDEALQVVFTYD